MSQPILYRIDHLGIIDVGGTDASLILHNLTTNEVKTLEAGQGRETFITNVKGKALSHGFLFRESDRFRFIGPHGPSETVRDHIDRYTIREDATPTIADDDWVAFVVNASDSGPWLDEVKGIPEHSDSPDAPLSSGDWQWRDFAGHAYRTRWLGDATLVLLIERASADGFAGAVERIGGELGDESAFHAARIKAGYPWYGVDFNDSNLPQEVDRDAETISFTKGCYLGQETVARLDALGQVQKKLVQWQADRVHPEAGTELRAGEKVVGRLTSVAADPSGFIAIGMARRTHFDPGSEADGVISETNESFTATVR